MTGAGHGPFAPVRQADDTPWRDQFVILAILAASALGAVTPLAGGYRILFPALAGGWAAVLFFRQRPATYISLCFWLFLTTPFIRRLVDYHVGYTEGSLVLLAPYAASALSLLLVPSFLFRRAGPIKIGIALVLAAAFYGLLLATLRGNLTAGLFDWLRWSVPPAIACYIVYYAQQRRAMLQALRAMAYIATPLLSLYAVYQFAFAPPWDTLWMVGSKMESIGQPIPYLIRAFGTLNSPGSFGFYIFALILMLLPGRSVTRYPSLLLAFAAIVISLVRAAWLALAIGMIIMAVIGNWRTRTSLALVPLAAVLMMPFALTSPTVEKLISDRVESMTSLARDKSARDRSEAYTALANEMGDNIFGSGLAIAGAFRSFGGGHEQRVIMDGGPIEVLRAFGPLGGSLYLGAVLLSLLCALSAPTFDDDMLVAMKSIAGALGTAFLSSTTTIGEMGMLFWIATGLLVAGAQRPQ
jgi:hypothetical protein